MPSRAFVVRFPNGDFEYEVRSGAAPEVGDMIRRRGAVWRVTMRDARDAVLTVHIEAVDERAAHSPPASFDDAT